MHHASDSSDWLISNARSPTNAVSIRAAGATDSRLMFATETAPASSRVVFALLVHSASKEALPHFATNGGEECRPGGAPSARNRLLNTSMDSRTRTTPRSKTRGQHAEERVFRSRMCWMMECRPGPNLENECLPHHHSFFEKPLELRLTH